PGSQIEQRYLLKVRQQDRYPALLPDRSGRRERSRIRDRQALVRALEVVDRQPHLLQVVFAFRAAGGGPRLLDGRQQQGYQHRNHSDDDEQLDQREGPAGGQVSVVRAAQRTVHAGDSSWGSLPGMSCADHSISNAKRRATLCPQIFYWPNLRR